MKPNRYPKNRLFREESDIIGNSFRPLYIQTVWVKRLESNIKRCCYSGQNIFHQYQYQTLSLVNFGDGSVVFAHIVIKKNWLWFCFIQMPLKKDLTVLTVSFCEKRKEMKMLDQTIVTIYLFFTGSFHTWIFIKYFYATETEDFKNLLRMDSVIYYEI